MIQLTQRPMTSVSRPTIALGPKAPQFGSWNWLGEDLARGLAHEFDTTIFTDEVPPCDAVLFVKFKPPLSVLQQIVSRSQVLYLPVDRYGSSAEIDADLGAWRCCAAVVVQCELLQRYFAPYAHTVYLDHPLKYITPAPCPYRAAGPLLWIGNHANLPPLVAWCNAHRLPDELWVLTNDVEPQTRPGDLGFRNTQVTRVEKWSPSAHVAWTAQCRGAIDIKDDSFRARYKPPAKANDFIASGVPFATLPNSSAAVYWHRRGLELASPEDPFWLSEHYWEQTHSAAIHLRESLSLETVAGQLAATIMDLL